MKNIWKLCLVLVLCAAMLLAGCSAKKTENDGTDATQEQTQGIVDNAGTTDAPDDADQPAEGNPEGDPYDSTAQSDTEGGSQEHSNGDTDNSGSGVNIDEDADNTGETEDDDFVVDFDDLV